MNIGHLVLTIVVVLILAGLLRGLVSRGVHPAAAVVMTGVSALVIRWLVHEIVDLDVFHFWENSWEWAFVILVIVAAIAIVRAWGLGLLVAMVAFLLAIGVGPNVPEVQARQDPAPGSEPQEPNTAEVPQNLGEWELHYYQHDEGVTDGYFGPQVEACKPGVGTVQLCLAEIKARLKRDPMLLSAKLRDFNLLDDFMGVPQEEYEAMNADQVERLRQQAAERLRDEQLRREWQPRVAAVYDSMRNLRLESFEGPYYTEFVTDDGVIHQSQRVMDPDQHYGMTGTLADGTEHTDKGDCGEQRVSRQPIPDVPVEEQPPPPTTAPPTTAPPTTAPPTTAPPTTVPPTTTTTGPPPTTTTTAPPPEDKCPHQPGVQTQPCGTPRSGPEQQDEPSTARPTPGYEEDSAEETVAEQPTNQEVQQTPSGTNSGSESGAPAGTHTGPGGQTSSGTDSGTQSPENTEGSGQTSSGDPGEPASFSRPQGGADPVLLLMGGLFLVSSLPPLMVRPRRYYR